MKYRLEKMNQVQYADDEARRKELEAKGFRVVNKGEDNRQGSGRLEGAGIGGRFVEAGRSGEEPEKTVKNVKKLKASKETKKQEAEKDPGTAEGEDKDAG